MNREFHLTAACLKIIAIVTMLIDHLTAVLYPYIYLLVTGTALTDPYSSPIYTLGRTIGRISYPLFAFMIAEGAYYTRDRKKYAMRVLLLALISIPFHNLARNGSFLGFEELNTVFGLFAGLSAIILIDKIRAGKEKTSFPETAAILAVLIILSVLCTVCRVEYYACSVLLITAFYYARKEDGVIARSIPNQKIRQAVMGIPAFLFGALQYLLCYFIYAYPVFSLTRCFSLACSTMKHEVWGLFAFVLIWFYNGKKGSKLPKYLFYAFYPVHLFIIGLIALYLGSL